MGFIGLCDGDPVVEYLRSTFGANIVRIPRASLRPPEVVAARAERARTMGHLGDILASDAPFVLEQADVHEEVAPPVLGFIAEHFGIRWSFGIGMPFVILSFAMAGVLGRRPTPHSVPEPVPGE